jgi:NADH-quinone oxidoreductase subunit N
MGVLTSVIGAYYYLRIIKIMYFDDPAEAFDKPIGSEIRIILGVSTIFVTLFILQPDLIVNRAAVAARVLFAG